MLGLQDMDTDRMLPSTLAQQQWPALKKETARPFTPAKELVYWGYKSSLLPSMALLCSLPSEFACTYLQFIHASHTERLGGGREPELPSFLLHLHPRNASAEIPKLLQSSSCCSQTSNTAFIYKAACWELVSQLEPWIRFMLLCFLQRIHLWGKNDICVFWLSIHTFDKRWCMKAGFPCDNTTFSSFHRASKLTIRANAHPASISTC